MARTQKNKATGELQPTIQTEDGFLELADPRGITILCLVHCSTSVAQGIRALCFKEVEWGGASKVDLRKRLSTMEQEEDLSCDFEDDDDETVKA
ncbi:hypothetical protein JHK82_055464 [Glycine max]|nr:hypothetical protein JHK86_055298 [Glycine max]KAG4918019.1 hypothetical protein JHK85_056300 [Glycine max]KAG5074101.1 hypothetical protein JHK84_055332 [Glycine max]KAG5076769.1 hypothetical protein JHK82_055464 [Glycine max]